jgi:hypothetical protein
VSDAISFVRATWPYVVAAGFGAAVAFVVFAWGCDR